MVETWSMFFHVHMHSKNRILFLAFGGQLGTFEHHTKSEKESEKEGKMTSGEKRVQNVERNAEKNC